MRIVQLLCFTASLFISSTASAQLERNRYDANLATQPQWVQLMYSANPDPGAVIAAYEAYYAANPFVKNSHTQYYKRWKRELGHDLVPNDPAQLATYGQDLRDYLDATEDLLQQRA